MARVKNKYKFGDIKGKVFVVEFATTDEALMFANMCCLKYLGKIPEGGAVSD